MNSFFMMGSMQEVAKGFFQEGIKRHRCIFLLQVLALSEGNFSLMQMAKISGAGKTITVLDYSI